MNDIEGADFDRWYPSQHPRVLGVLVALSGDADLAHDATDDAVPDPQLWEAVRGLPVRQRQVVALRYVGDLPETAIAAALGIARGTVASTLADRHGAQAASIMRSGRRPGGAGDAADGTGLPAPAGIDWTLNAWRAGPDGASATLALLTDDVAAAAEAMELLADHEPERDGELVWVTIDGDADAVAAELSEAAHAVGLPSLE